MNEVIISKWFLGIWIVNESVGMTGRSQGEEEEVICGVVWWWSSQLKSELDSDQDVVLLKWCRTGASTTLAKQS